MTEIEVKLPIESVPAVRRRLRQLGWQVSVRRCLERNWVYDRADHSLWKNGCLLRVRQVGKCCRLTVKGPPKAGTAHKVREEFEIESNDLASTRKLLEALEYETAWIYEKFRTEFKRPRDKGKILLDETPIGSYLELEGEPSWIDRTAKRLGFDSLHYITASYRTLFVEHTKTRRPPPNHMVFEDSAAQASSRLSAGRS